MYELLALPDHQDMADFNFVTGRVATGAAISDADDVQQLLAAGVTHIIDCRAEFDDGQLLAGSGAHYLFAPQQDDGQHPKPVSWFQAGIEFALPALAQPGTKVYAHCAAGCNRGPSMAAAILMAQGLSEAEAGAMIRSARPQVTLAYIEDATAAVQELGY